MKRSYPVLEDLSRSLANAYQTQSIPPSVGGAPYLRVLRDGTHFLTVLQGAKGLVVKYYEPHHKEDADTLSERLKRILDRGTPIEIVGSGIDSGLSSIASRYDSFAPPAYNVSGKSHHKNTDPSANKAREERAAHKIARYETLGKVLAAHPDIGKQDILKYMAKAGYNLSQGEYQMTIADLRTALPEQGKELRVKGMKKSTTYRVVRKYTRQS